MYLIVYIYDKGTGSSQTALLIVSPYSFRRPSFVLVVLLNRGFWFLHSITADAQHSCILSSSIFCILQSLAQSLASFVPEGGAILCSCVKGRDGEQKALPRFDLRGVVQK